MNRIIIPKLSIEELRIWTTPAAMNKVVLVYHIVNNVATQLCMCLNGSKLGLAISNSIDANLLYMTYLNVETRYEYYTSDRFDLKSPIYQLFIGSSDTVPKYELYSSTEEVNKRLREVPSCLNYTDAYVITHTFNDAPIATSVYTPMRV